MGKVSKLIILALFLSGCHNSGKYQKNETIPQKPETNFLVAKCNHIIKLIEEDNISAISDLIPYPVVRWYLPPINTKQEFIGIYSGFFDSLSKEFKKHPITVNDTTLFWMGGGINFLWFSFCDSGVVKSFDADEPDSGNEAKWERSDKNGLYPALRNYFENCLILETNTLLIRVDIDSTESRLSAWNKGHSMSEKPLLVLHHGSGDNSGTMGYFSFKFNNQDLVYTVYNEIGCPNDEIWLDIDRGEKEIKHLRCRILKEFGGVVKTDW